MYIILLVAYINILIHGIDASASVFLVVLRSRALHVCLNSHSRALYKALMSHKRVTSNAIASRTRVIITCKLALSGVVCTVSGVKKIRILAIY